MQSPQAIADGASMSVSGTPGSMGSSTMEIVPRLRPVTSFMALASETVRQPQNDGLREVLQNEVHRLKTVCQEEVKSAFAYYAGQAQGALRAQSLEHEAQTQRVVQQVSSQDHS